ncbi:hypothetical protein ACTFIZ_003882 [Dictyostelium cf. discoideum]
MGNTFSFMSNVTGSEKLSSFKIQKTPTYDEISRELSELLVSRELIDDIFERCCFMTIDFFFDTYKSDDTLKCQHSPTKSEWFFTCSKCCLANNSCICTLCFLNGNHISEGHSFSLFEANQAAVCDCGNSEAIKREGFCSDHINVNETSKKERIDKLPFFIKKDVHIFFRYLFQHLQNLSIKSTAATSQSNCEKLEQFGIIQTIINWLSDVCKESSTLIHIMAEEFTQRELEFDDDNNNNNNNEKVEKEGDNNDDNDDDDDDYYYSKFKLYQHKPLPYKSDNESIQQQWEGHHFLGYIFSKIELLDQFLPLLVLLIDNHNAFKIVLFEEYLKNYISIFSPRDSKSSSITLTIASFYMENKILVPFSTGYSRHNVLELILRSHKTIYVPLLLPFYQADSKVEKEVMLQSDLSAFTKLMKNPLVVKYFSKQEDKFKLLFEFAEQLHRFTSPQFVDPSITTTKFLLLMEHRLLLSIRSMFQTAESIRDQDPEFYQFLTDKVTENLITNMEKIKKRPTFDRCGMQLPHQDFFQKFTYSEIPVHFPLYRMMSTMLLMTKMDPMLLISKYNFQEADIIDMLTTLLLFRVCYVSYDDNNSIENCTDITMVSDLHMIQISISLLGPKKFLYIFFNVLTSIDTNPAAFTDIFSMLIGSLQLRATLTPTKQDIVYSLLQGVFSGIFFKQHFRSFDSVLLDVTEDQINDIYLPEITSKGNQAKELLNNDMWQYFDPYYPLFSINYRNLIKTNAKDRFKKYQTLKKIPESNPLPPIMDPLPLELSGVSEIYNDPTLFEIILCVVVDCVFPSTFVGYDDSFEMQPILKMLISKPDTILGEMFYIFVLGIKSFKEFTLPKLIQSEKQLIIETIIDYFNSTTNQEENNDKEDDEKVENQENLENQENQEGKEKESIEKIEEKEEDRIRRKNNNSRFKFDFTLKTKNYAIYNLLRIYNVEIDIGIKEKLSFLDILFKFWDLMTNKSQYLELRSSLLYIFNFLLEFDPIFEKVFSDNKIDLVLDVETSTQDELAQKKLMAEKKERLLQQMRDQQKSFLENYKKILVEEDDEEEEDDDGDENHNEKENHNEIEQDEEGEEKQAKEENEQEEEEEVAPLKLRNTIKAPETYDDDDDNDNDDEHFEKQKEQSTINIEIQSGGIDENEINNEITKEKQYQNEGEQKEEVEEIEEEEEDEEKGEEVEIKVEVKKSNKINKYHKHESRKIEISIEEEGEFEPCIICKSGERGGRLFTMGYIDLSSVNHQNSVQNNFNLANDTEMGLDPLYQHFIETFYFTDIKPGTTHYIPFKDDPAGLFACYIFQRSPSTYISSCGHNIHKNCLDKYVKEQEQQKIDESITAFNCPLCSRPSDFILPLGEPQDSNQYKSYANDMFTKLCYYDFLILMDSERKYSIDKYLWKFVLQNIETLELKSRKTNLYSQDDYFIISEIDFQKELTTTTRLFNVITSADVEPDQILPIYDPSTFFMDPFTSSSYSIFLSKKDHLSLIFEGLSKYLFNIVLFHCIKKKVVPENQLNNNAQTQKLVENEFQLLFSNNNNSSLDKDIELEFKNQIHPYIRKVLILYSLISNTTLIDTKDDFPTVPSSNTPLTVELLSDFDKCIGYFGYSNIQSMFNHLLNKDTFESTLSKFMRKKKITSTISTTPTLYCSYPPPSDYRSLPRFISLPEKFVTLMQDNICAGNCPCDSLLKLVCLLCGQSVCTVNACKKGAVSHCYVCSSTPLGFFHLIDKPIIKVFHFQFGSFKNSFYTHIYLDKDGQKSSTTSVEISLSQKRLKKIYKYWMDTTNSRKFLITK